MRASSNLRPADRTVGPSAISHGFGRRNLIFVVLALAALTSLLYVNQTGDLASTGYDVADLQNQKQQLEMRNEQLRLQVGQLESLDRIDQLASTQLKMGPPRNEIYVAAPSVRIPPPVTPAAATPADR
jgi:cell division protein FtsL